MLHRDAHAKHLAAARIAVFGIWLVIALSTPFPQLAQLPHSMFEPAGLIAYMPVEALMTSSAALGVLRGFVIVTCALCILGIRPFRPVAVAAVIGIALFDGTMKSYAGFVNHAQLAALYAAVILAMFPAADAWSLTGRLRRGADRTTYVAPMVVCGLVLTLAYSLLGIRRLMVGGLEVFVGDSLPIWLVSRSLEHSAYGFDYGLLALSSPAVAGLFKAGMAVVTSLEIASPIALFHRRFRYLWLIVLIPFHIVTMFTMNILFWENLVLIAFFVSPFLYTIPGLRSRDISNAFEFQSLAGEGDEVAIASQCEAGQAGG